jgi:3-methyladenine DNA glycosylase AlkD
MAKKLTTNKTKPKAGKAKAAPAQAKSTTMTLEEAMRQLKSLGNEGVRAQNTKRGAGDNQFGVKLGDIRILANKIKANHELALALWKSGNLDAQFLATLLIDVNLLSADEMERMVKSVPLLSCKLLFPPGGPGG